MTVKKRKVVTLEMAKRQEGIAKHKGRGSPGIKKSLETRARMAASQRRRAAQVRIVGQLEDRVNGLDALNTFEQ
jgi:hypothetical protein